MELVKHIVSPVIKGTVGEFESVKKDTDIGEKYEENLETYGEAIDKAPFRGLTLKKHQETSKTYKKWILIRWITIITILIIIGVLGIFIASIWILGTLWALLLTYNNPEYYSYTDFTITQFGKRLYDSITTWYYIVPMYYLKNRRVWKYKMILYRKKQEEMKKLFEEEEKRITKLRAKQEAEKSKIVKNVDKKGDKKN